MNEREIVIEMIRTGPKLPRSTLLDASGDETRIKAVRSLLFRLGFGEQLEWNDYGADGGYGTSTRAAVAELARRNAFKLEHKKEKGAIVTRRLAERMLALDDALESLELLAGDVKAKRCGDVYRDRGDEARIIGLQSLLKLLLLKPSIFKQLKVDGDYRATGRHLDRFAVSNRGTGNNATALSQGMARHLLTRLTKYYGKDWSTARATRPPNRKRQETEPEPEAENELTIGQDMKDTGSVNDNGTERERQDVHVGLPGGETERDERGWALSTRNGITARVLALRPADQQQENWCWAACSEMVVEYLRSLGEVECPACGRRGPGDHAPTQGALAKLRGPKTEIDCSKREDTEEWFDACDCPNLPYFYEFESLVRSTEWASRRHVLEEHGLQLVAGGPRLKVSYPLSDWQLKNLWHNGGWQLQKRLALAEGCAVTWETLTRLLDARRPVAFSFRFRRGGGAHMRVAAGYAVTADNRWVVVYDPLPPGTGERYLIPYEYYKEGPFGGHLRDYWIAPLEEGAAAPPRPTSEELRVGHELVACYRPEPVDRPKGESGKERYELSRKDRDAARVEALKGLAAVEEIATHAKELAIMLGMGGNFLQIFGARVVAAAADRDILPESPQDEVGFEDVAAADLELADEPVPIYEVDQHTLAEWEPKVEGIGGLLGRPREVIWEIQRPKLEPFSFFACVTVRRHGDTWRLASLGKTFLMAMFAQRQLLSSLVNFSERDRPFSFEQIMRGLRRLGLLEPFVRHLAEKDLRAFAKGLNYSPAEVEAYLQGGRRRGTLRTDVLLEKARRLDRESREERKQQRKTELDELRRALQGKKYDITLEDLQQTIAKGRKALKTKRDKLDAASRAGDSEKLERARVELDKKRVALDKRLDEEAGWVLRGGKRRREAFLKWACRGTDPQTAQAFKKIVEYEAKLEEMRTKPSPDLGKLLELKRDRDIEWLRQRTWRQVQLDEQKLEALEKWSKTADKTIQEEIRELVRRQQELDEFERAHAPTPANLGERLRLTWEKEAALRRMQPMIPYLSRSSCQEATERLSALESAKRLDAQEEKDQDRPEPIPIEKPEFILDIQDLYQLLIGYSSEEVVPVYPKAFRRPGRHVEEGRLVDVLKSLRKVAQEG